MTAVLEQPRRVDGVAAMPWRRWRYAGGRRDQRLDLLRGFSAFAMIVDHTGGGQSLLYPLTGGNQFYTGAAEAFVVISGLVMGIVYRSVISHDGIGAALSKSMQRSGMLYLLTVGLTLGFAAMSALLALPWAPHLSLGQVASWVVGVLTLHQTFFLADVMLMYTFLVLAAGPLLALLARGRWRLVLAGSWALWLLWQLWPEQAQVPWAVAGNTTFHLPAWQVLFMTALVAGYHRAALERRLARLHPEFALVVSGAVLLAAALLFFRGPAALAESGWAAPLVDKPNVGFGRIVVFAAAFAFAYSVVTLAWTPVRAVTGRLLMPLGHHALSAYALHIFVVGIVWKLTGLAGGHTTWPAAANAAVQLAATATVWLAIGVWPRAMAVADCCPRCLAHAGQTLQKAVHHEGHLHQLGNRPPPCAEAARGGAVGHGGGIEPHSHCA